MPFDIPALQADAKEAIKNCLTLEDLDKIRNKYLGRKGVILEMTSQIPNLPVHERPIQGRLINELKKEIAILLEAKHNEFRASISVDEKPVFDETFPAFKQELGHKHPLSITFEEICKIFQQCGFSIEEGPEIETEFNNFTGLNIPLDHPSRDAFDTFYLQPQKHENNTKAQKLLLRSHTSPVQVRVMKSRKPPLAVVVPGKVYRPDAVDSSHSFMFHQIEGFLVDKDIKFSDLKGMIDLFLKSYFGKGITMRFRPHFFPFTEPSAEVDISCIICGAKGCSVCGKKGWLEIMGCGMIHPNVFKQVGYPRNKYTGFAFGMGVDRIAMLKYGIDDIRLLYENDIRFLKQF
ncbi:MAG: phenylalanine--tRNA ligase subunit alpha [Candidatus Omnitrophota bacterium]